MGEKVVEVNPNLTHFTLSQIYRDTGQVMHVGYELSQQSVKFSHPNFMVVVLFPYAI